MTNLTTEPMLTLMPNPLPPLCPTRVALLAKLAAYQTKAAAADDGSKSAILEKSDYDLRQPGVRGMVNGVPPAPMIFLRRGKVSGAVVARVKPLLPHTDAYEAEYAVGESTANAGFTGWVTATTGSRITLEGLEVAKMHQVRVRGVDSKVPGDWSEPASIIVT